MFFESDLLRADTFAASNLAPLTKNVNPLLANQDDLEALKTTSQKLYLFLNDREDEQGQFVTNTVAIDRITYYIITHTHFLTSFILCIIFSITSVFENVAVFF